MTGIPGTLCIAKKEYFIKAFFFLKPEYGLPVLIAKCDYHPYSTTQTDTERPDTGHSSDHYVVLLNACNMFFFIANRIESSVR